MESELDIYEEKGNLIIELGIPRLLQEDEVDINLTQNHLKIIGKRNISKEITTEGGAHSYGVSSGSFSQEINLPVIVIPKKMKKEFKPGLIKLVIPKKD
jgi:HSP20 family molecular chaperone IbpA